MLYNRKWSTLQPFPISIVYCNSMRKPLITTVILLWAGCLFAQIQRGGTPRAWGSASTLSTAQFNTEGVNMTKLTAEDAINDQRKDVAWRFGGVINQSFDLRTSGQWHQVTGGRICLLTVYSPGANSLNLNYSDFSLPPGSDLFIYTPDRKNVLGRFTPSNNKNGGAFATTLLPGDKCVLEYFEPTAQMGKGVIKVQSIVHGYRGFFSSTENFGASGGCNIDMICDSIRWWDEARSGVLIVTGANNRVCSGALLNNTRQDGTPYVLSAAHCGVPPNAIFMFNYRSPSCTNQSDGPTGMTVAGCTPLAVDGPFDFNLVRLDTIPPGSYNVFYSGWSKDTIPPECATGIHHPQGDVQKISHDFDSVTISGYYSAGTDHWQVRDWNTGTTEPVSSGSPLYDAHHRVIGQLHGGAASCSNDAQDYYGQFAVAWDTYSDSARQLEYWLDPDGILSGQYLPGYDPSGPVDQRDAMLLKIVGIQHYSCLDTLVPGVIFRNHGSDPLTSLNIHYSVDGGTVVTTNWSGNLTSYDTRKLWLNPMPLSQGKHTIKIYCSSPNGLSDMYLLNDTLTKTFTTNDTNVAATMTFKTDNFGSESTWKILDPTGTVLYSDGPYPDVVGGVVYTTPLCLWDDCFLLVVRDQFADGTCCTFGKGYHLITNAIGDTLGLDTNFTGAVDSIAFCPGDTCNIYLFGKVTDATNGTSADGSVDLFVTGMHPPYTYQWSPGGQTTQDLSGLNPGTYSVLVTDSMGCSDTLAFTIGSSVGIDDAQELQFSVYPNPTEGLLYIQNDHEVDVDGMVTVYDMTGRVVIQQQMALTPGNRKMIDLQSLDTQLVILQVSMGREKRHFKIVVR